jgi:hypothetical protein
VPRSTVIFTLLTFTTPFDMTALCLFIRFLVPVVENSLVTKGGPMAQASVGLGPGRTNGDGYKNHEVSPTYDADY